MQKAILALAASGIALAGGIAVSQAQQPSGPMMQQDRPGMMMRQPGGGAGQQTAQPDDRGPGMMGGMMGRGDGPGMMGGRMSRGDGPGMMRMMMVMMDTNGDGALSQEEIQAVHTRMFNYADVDKDGKLTLEELQGFFHGGSFGPR